MVGGVLTHIELAALLLEGVAAPAGLVVLLQHQHPLAHLSQGAGRRQATYATADDHGIQVPRHTRGAEP